MERIISIHFNDIEDDAVRIGLIPYNFKKGFLMSKVIYKEGHMFGDLGGGCKKNESSIKCLFREIIEEAGINFLSNILYINLTKYSTVLKYINFYNKDQCQYMVFVPVSQNIIDYFHRSSEIYNMEWVKMSYLQKIRFIQHIPIKKFIKYIYMNKYLLSPTMKIEDTIKMIYVIDVVLNPDNIKKYEIDKNNLYDLIDLNPDLIHFIQLEDNNFIMKIILSKKRKFPYLKHYNTDDKDLKLMALRSNKDNIKYMN